MNKSLGIFTMLVALSATANAQEAVESVQTSGFADSFMVTGITVSGKSCMIESKHNTALGAELSDMILAQPCKKLR